MTFFAARNTPPTRLRPGSRLNTHRMPSRRASARAALAAGDEHLLLVTDAGEAFRDRAFRGEFRGGARVAALVFDAGAPGSGSGRDDSERRENHARRRRLEAQRPGGRRRGARDGGWGLYGQLGHETCEDASDPKPVAALGACFARAVAAGAAHTSVLVSTGGRAFLQPRRTAGRAAERVRARRGRRRPRWWSFRGTTRDASTRSSARRRAVHVGLRGFVRRQAHGVRHFVWRPGHLGLERVRAARGEGPRDARGADESHRAELHSGR